MCCMNLRINYWFSYSVYDSYIISSTPPPPLCPISNKVSFFSCYMTGCSRSSVYYQSKGRCAFQFGRNTIKRREHNSEYSYRGLHLQVFNNNNYYYAQKPYERSIRLKPRFRDRQCMSQRWLSSQATSSRLLTQNNEKLVWHKEFPHRLNFYKNVLFLMSIKSHKFNQLNSVMHCRTVSVDLISSILRKQ